MPSKKPNFLASVFVGLWGLMFLFVGMVGLFLGQFRFGSAPEGYKVIAASEHPVFFAVCLLFSFGFGLLGLCRAVTDLRRGAQARRRDPCKTA